MSPRLDTPILFPGLCGGHLNLHSFRAKRWKPAVRAAGIDYRTPYAMRHTFSLFALSRQMGTSIEQIDKTYGHLLPDADEAELRHLDEWDNREAVEAAEGN